MDAKWRRPLPTAECGVDGHCCGCVWAPRKQKSIAHLSREHRQEGVVPWGEQTCIDPGKKKKEKKSRQRRKKRKRNRKHIVIIIFPKTDAVFGFSLADARFPTAKQSSGGRDQTRAGGEEALRIRQTQSILHNRVTHTHAHAHTHAETRHG